MYSPELDRRRIMQNYTSIIQKKVLQRQQETHRHQVNDGGRQGKYIRILTYILKHHL